MNQSLRAAAILPTAILAAALAACSDDSSSTSTSSGLSQSFQANCARCHGAEGRGSGQYPKIPGSKDEAGFIDIVRHGESDMPAFTPAQISDADLKADYLWLTTKRL